MTPIERRRTMQVKQVGTRIHLAKREAAGWLGKQSLISRTHFAVAPAAVNEAAPDPVLVYEFHL